MPRQTPSLPLRSAALAVIVLPMLSAAPGVGAATLLDTITPPPERSALAATRDEVIPATEIPTRADADERYIHEVRERARQKDPNRQLEPRLQALGRGVRELAAEVQRDPVAGLPVVRLESLERHWNFYDRQLADWRRELQRFTAGYSDDAAELSTRRAVWENTRQAPGLAPALASRARVIADEAARAEQAISGPLDAQLKLGRKANTLQANIDSGTKAVVDAIREHDLNLHTADAPPLWAMDGESSFEFDVSVGEARTGLTIEREFLEEYVVAYKGRLLFNVTIALLTLPLLLWLGMRSRRLVSDDPDLTSSAHVLLRPLSAWLVLVLVAVPFALPDAPMIVHQAALLLAVIPVLRLLPAEVYAALGPAPYVVTGLYVVQRLGFLLVGHSLLYRLHLLAVTLLAALALIWILRSRRPDTTGAISFPVRAWRFLGVLAAVALALSFFAIVVGNLALAEVITSGVVISSYVALALYAGGSVLTSMVRLLLARKSVSKFRIVMQRTGPLLRGLGRLIRFGTFVVWILVTLNGFRVLRPVVETVRRFLAFPIEAGQISITLGSILLFALSVWAAFWFAKSIRFVLQDEVLPKMALPRGVGNSISTLSYYALITVGLLVALAAAGFETSQLTLVFGALSLGIGFGLQNVVNNFVSGLILMFERPIQPGDVVEVSGTSGKVREIGMRATTLTTFEGADVIVPNGTLLSEKLINWTLSDMNRRIDVDVGVAYGSDPRRVMELLARIATSTPGISPEPEPAVVFLRFGASSLDFGIRAWTNDFSNWVSLRSQLTIAVYEALQTEGIEIPFPQQDLHLRSVSEEAAARMATTTVARSTPAADSDTTGP